MTRLGIAPDERGPYEHDVHAARFRAILAVRLMPHPAFDPQVQAAIEQIEQPVVRIEEPRAVGGIAKRTRKFAEVP